MFVGKTSRKFISKQISLFHWLKFLCETLSHKDHAISYLDNNGHPWRLIGVVEKLSWTIIIHGMQRIPSTLLVNKWYSNLYEVNSITFPATSLAYKDFNWVWHWLNSSLSPWNSTNKQTWSSIHMGYKHSYHNIYITLIMAGCKKPE